MIEAEINVNRSFQAALVLTGSIETAESAVLGAIADLECGVAGGLLLMASAKWAIQLRDTLTPQVLPSSLPLELRRLFLLSPVCRDCVVLRTLLGFSSEVTSGILHLQPEKIDEALCDALNDLAQLGGMQRAAWKGFQCVNNWCAASSYVMRLQRSQQLSSV